MAASNKKNVIRVLYVDDDPSLLEISKLLLMDMGNFEIDSAYSVDEAFKKLSTGQYDVVVSDYEMPQKDGLQFLAELRKQNNNIPFILFTGKGREEVAIKALNLGADGYYNKQGNPETVYGELAHGIRLNIERKKAAQALKKQAALIDLSPDAIIVKNTDETITFWNAGAEKLYGYTKEEAIGQKINILLKAKKSNSFDDVITQLKQCKSWTGEISNYTKNNNKVTVQSYWTATLDAQGGIMEILESNVDITQRKIAEASLGKNEEQLKAIILNAPIGIAWSDSKKFFLSANESFCRILGYSENELQKLTFKEITHPDDINDSTSKMEELSSGRISFFSQEKRYIRKDGTIINGKVTVSAIRNKEGKPTLFIAELEDITERKKADDASRKSKEEYSSLFSNMIDGFAYCQMIFDEVGKPVDFVYLQVNDAFERITGLKRDLIIGKKVSQAIPEIKETNPELFEIYGRVSLTGQKEKFEHVLKPLNLWLNVSVYSPAKGYFAAVLEDITERKKSEEAMISSERLRKRMEDELKASEERLRLLFEYAPDAYYLTDLKGTFVDGNKIAEEVTGYTRSELIGKSFLSLNLLPRNQILKAAKLLSLNAIGKPTGPDEFILNRKNGTKIPVEIRTQPLKIQGKKLVLGIALDITERKKAEEELKIAATIFDLATDSIFVHDMDGNIVNFNEAAYKLRGYSKEEMAKMNIQDLDSPESAKWVKPRINELLRNGSAVFESIEVCKDKSLLPVELHVRLIELGGKKLFLSVARDITERKEVEKKLKENNARIELMNEKLCVAGSLTRHDVRNKLSAVNGYTYLLKKKHADQADIAEGLSKIELAVKDSVKIFEFAKMYEQLGVEELSYADVGKAVDEAGALFSGLTIRVVNDCHGVRVLADSFLRQMFYNLIDNTRKYGEKASIIKVHCEEAESGELRLVYQNDGVGISAENKSKLFAEGFSTGGSTGFGLFLIKKMMDIYGWQIQENGTPGGGGAKFTITIPKLNKNGKENYQIAQ